MEFLNFLFSRRLLDQSSVARISLFIQILWDPTNCQIGSANKTIRVLKENVSTLQNLETVQVRNSLVLLLTTSESLDCLSTRYCLVEQEHRRSPVG